jgi:hypothetical protein
VARGRCRNEAKIFITVSEIKLRPKPRIDVYAHPAAALDVRKKRLLEKELRAAWGEKQARWLTSTDATHDGEPTLYLSCEEGVAATAIALNVRIGLAHFVSGVRRRLTEWLVQFTLGAAMACWSLRGVSTSVLTMLLRVFSVSFPGSKSMNRRADNSGTSAMLEFHC